MAATRRWRIRRSLFEAAWIAALLVATGGRPVLAQQEAPAPADGDSPGVQEVRLTNVPHPDLSTLEPAVAEQLRERVDLLQQLLGEKDLSPAEAAEAYGQLGRLYLAYELDTPAAACLYNASLLAPAEFRWPYLLAYSLHRTGQLAQADQAYQAALRLDPWSAPAMIRLAQLYLEQDRIPAAEPLLERALEARPGSPAVRAAQGQIALSRRDWPAAVAAFEEALAATPDANRLHYPLGLAYRGLGDVDKARQHLRQRGEVGVKPADPHIDSLAELKTGERAHLLRGQLAFRAGRFEDAAASFTKAVEAEPESARALINRASARVQLRQVEGAIADLEKALELQPDNVTGHFNLGVLSSRLGRAAAAVGHLRQVVDERPKDAEARLELGAVLRATGEPEAALQHYEEGVRLAPYDQRGHLGLASILVDLERFREAADVLDVAEALMPENLRIVYSLSRLLSASPDREVRDGARALELAQKSYGLDPRAETAGLMAEALAEVGRCAEVDGWYQIAVGRAEKEKDQEGLDTFVAGLVSSLRTSKCNEGSNKPETR